MLPDFKCREAQFIYVLTVLLVVRTLMSIWLADVNGQVVKAIVNKSLSQFLSKVCHRPFLIAYALKCVADFQLVLVRRAFIDHQLGHRLYPEETGPSIPQAPNLSLPLGIPEKHALLQDLQLGQSHF